MQKEAWILVCVLRVPGNQQRGYRNLNLLLIRWGLQESYFLMCNLHFPFPLRFLWFQLTATPSFHFLLLFSYLYPFIFFCHFPTFSHYLQKILFLFFSFFFFSSLAPIDLKKLFLSDQLLVQRGEMLNRCLSLLPLHMKWFPQITVSDTKWLALYSNKPQNHRRN